MVSSAKALCILSGGGEILLTKRHQKRALYDSGAVNLSSGRASWRAFCLCAFRPQKLCYFITSAENALQRAFLMFCPLKATLQQMLSELGSRDSSFHHRWCSSTNVWNCSDADVELVPRMQTFPSSSGGIKSVLKCDLPSKKKGSGYDSFKHFRASDLLPWCSL